MFQSSEAIGILIVHPAAPYLDWARTMCDDEVVLSVIGKSPTAYIVPEADTEAELESYRDEWFPNIFHEELNSWCRDTDQWPQDRSWNRFKEWFTWTWHPMVFDTERMILTD